VATLSDDSAAACGNDKIGFIFHRSICPGADGVENVSCAADQPRIAASERADA